MPLSVSDVQALAPDQSSLTAAGRLLAVKHWRTLAADDATDAIWGECQGSGANPYRVVVEVGVRGYKCTCPSRKFPCKHTLALIWINAEQPDRFAAAPVPDWVSEWLGRARRPASGSSTSDGATAGKSLELARARADGGTDPALDPEQAAERERAAERRARAGAKRQADTHEAVTGALADLELWIGDQLRSGLLALAADPGDRCRAIAARLVDGKATAFGSRIDELPAKLLAMPRPERARAVAFEMGQWTLLARAWARDPDDPDVRSAVIRAPDREQVLTSDGAVRVAGPWQVTGVRSSTRRDGLVSRQTWLHRLGDSKPAVLQDFLPAAVARQGAAFTPGQRLDDAIVYYPSRFPVRAVLAGNEPAAGQAIMDDGPAGGVLATYRRHLSLIPWAETTPVRLGAGRLARAGNGDLWWCDELDRLPVTPIGEAALWSALQIESGAALWDGARLTLLQVRTAIGSGYPGA